MKTLRRTFLKETLGGIALLSLPSLLQAEAALPQTLKKIVMIGGHPDDPECGAGGTAARLVQQGHEVVFIYLTNGDEGIEDLSHEQAAAIRKQEASDACRLLGVRPVFFGQVDGESFIDNAEMNRFQELLRKEEPEVVFTHWPLDSHKDHQLASVLTMQTWAEADENSRFALYFYEVCLGDQSFLFQPSDYVDITSTHALKWEALALHKSQHLYENGTYTELMLECGHPMMEDFRGREAGVRKAEAFIRMTGRGMGALAL